jgi:N-acetyl-anhydromuramyl-L-alanine amidase AmpD
MNEINDGRLVDSRVTFNTYKSIEHDAMNKVNSIVLHRTDSATGSTTLNAYKNGQTTGAHFLIDENGKIYQTASLKKSCWHVGILLPRCEVEKNCDPKELRTITALIHEEGLTFSRRVKNLSVHETKKKYPLRYPSNSDSIGIEVVGRFLVIEKSFEKASRQQLNSIKWLVEALANYYQIDTRSNIYAHGAIARKQVSEGADLLQYIFSGTIHE